jgi:hypothetical protein
MLWDERRWGNDRFPIQELLDSPGVKIIGEWRHPDTGRMILLELKDAGWRPRAAVRPPSCPDGA